MTLLELTFKSFWHFAGFLMILGLLCQFILKMWDIFLRLWNRAFRHWNIRKHGYPPPHCDADGDFKP